MANRKLYWGIPGLLLVFGLILTGCKDDGGDPDPAPAPSNPFVGTWNGTAHDGYNSSPATIIVTDSTWNFICQEISMNESGSYTYSGNSATLNQGGSVFGSATISGNTLSVSLTSGIYAGGTGTFSK
jgi:hypothetical protein